MILQLPLLPNHTVYHTHLQQHTGLPQTRLAFCTSSRLLQRNRAAQHARPVGRQQATITRCIAEVAPPRIGFADVQSEAEFKAVLDAGVAAKKIPSQLVPAFLDFYNNYKSEPPCQAEFAVHARMHERSCPTAVMPARASHACACIGIAVHAAWVTLAIGRGAPRGPGMCVEKSGRKLINAPCCVAAVLGSGVPGADEQRVAQVMAAIADRVCDQFVHPYTFPSFHARILEPYNYYAFGQV